MIHGGRIQSQIKRRCKVSQSLSLATFRIGPPESYFRLFSIHHRYRTEQNCKSLKINEKASILIFVYLHLRRIRVNMTVTLKRKSYTPQPRHSQSIITPWASNNRALFRRFFVRAGILLTLFSCFDKFKELGLLRLDTTLEELKSAEQAKKKRYPTK